MVVSNGIVSQERDVALGRFTMIPGSSAPRSTCSTTLSFYSSVKSECASSPASASIRQRSTLVRLVIRCKRPFVPSNGARVLLCRLLSERAVFVGQTPA
jgi:hypothetical protein